ncbi:hypothetical protein [Methanomethylovorans sp.]|uniref:hypothetical protein n=1 Tax=Methanomethylovorans sp. TaxID=2758717 RepID=UPI002FDEC1F1
MNSKGMEAGSGHTPAIENCAALHINDPKLYIIDPGLQQLRNEPVIRDFANVKPDTYELIKATNPTLLMFVDLARKIMEEAQ